MSTAANVLWGVSIGLVLAVIIRRALTARRCRQALRSGKWNDVLSRRGW